MAHEYLQQLTHFIDHLSEQRYDNIDLECKHFFSGAALYVNNRICITLTPVGMGIKLPQHTREKLLTDNKAIALKYFPQGPIKKDYVLFPNGVETGHRKLDRYVTQSIDYLLKEP